MVALLTEPLDRGTPITFQPSSLQFTTVDVDNPATNVIPGQATATLQTCAFNDTYNPKSLETELRQRLDLSGARYGPQDLRLPARPS